jgi:hypothetical protein
MPDATYREDVVAFDGPCIDVGYPGPLRDLPGTNQ